MRADLEGLFEASARTLTEALAALAADRAGRVSPRDALADAPLARVAELLGEIGTLADLAARVDLRRGMRAAGVALAEPAPLASVPFDRAIESLLAREPELARSAAEVQAVHARRGFAVARSTDLEVTRRVQEEIAAGLITGRGVRDVADLLAAIGDWTHAYAETVQRTNVTSAYAAGRFDEARELETLGVLAGLEYVTAGDVDVRPNHQAADGLIAAVDDAVWAQLSPPLGYRCRCGLELVTWERARSKGLVVRGRRLRPARVPAGAGADRGFVVTRPDRAVYGA